MEAGALGLSCGIMYTPECYSTTEDFAFLAKVAGEYGGYLTSHIRGGGQLPGPVLWRRYWKSAGKPGWG